MYGYFTHGTDPPPRPCSSGFLSLPDRLRWLPSPTHFRRRLPGHAVFTALKVLHSHPSTDRALLATSLSLIGLLTPVPPEDPASPPEVTRCSSVPCRPQTPCYRGRMSDAFASYTQARPLPLLADQFILELPPRLRPGTSPHALRIPPHDGHPALRRPARAGSRSALACVRLSLSCPFRLLHTFSPSPASEALPPLSDTALLIRAPEGLKPSRTARCSARVYHCFDRIVINGYLSGLSRPEQVVWFFREVLGFPVVSKEVLSQRTKDYQGWVEA
jgi:hypothetical protein